MTVTVYEKHYNPEETYCEIYLEKGSQLYHAIVASYGKVYYSNSFQSKASARRAITRQLAKVGIACNTELESGGAE